jgi:hypothetical protein
LHRGLAAARDPDDFDARAKDFNATNFAAYSKMTDAFAPGSRFTIWGCSATTHFKFRSRLALQAIQRGVAEDDFFTVRSEMEDHDAAVGVFLIEEEHTSELRHRWTMDALFRRSTYAAEAAKKLGIEVRAGCPGTGSDPTTVEGIEMLMVDLVGYHDVFEYFHKKFAPEFAETKDKWDRGYVDYHAIQSRAVVAKPPFSTEYYDLSIQTKVTRWQPAAGAQIKFWNGKSVAHPTPNVQVVMKLAADQLGAPKDEPACADPPPSLGVPRKRSSKAKHHRMVSGRVSGRLMSANDGAALEQLRKRTTRTRASLTPRRCWRRWARGTERRRSR